MIKPDLSTIEIFSSEFETVRAEINTLLQQRNNALLQIQQAPEPEAKQLLLQTIYRPLQLQVRALAFTIWVPNFIKKDKQLELLQIQQTASASRLAEKIILPGEGLTKKQTLL